MREGECAGKGNWEAGKQIANIPGMPEEMKKEGKFERKQADRQGGRLWIDHDAKTRQKANFPDQPFEIRQTERYVY